jgi:EAL domain-containing protein (putative c-di-GMP-specific phosphodiesterase class I)
MYAAKRKGTGIEIYDSRMHEEVAGRLLLETELHVALAENQFFLNYQPFYSIPSGQLAGFEALLRWQHPRRGTVLPGHFISVLEETRMVLPLTRWLISESCRKLWEWNANRRDERCLLMSVNVSAIHFGAANLVAEVAEVIAETGVDSRWLGIEVTESALMENPEAAERQMGALQDMGVQTIIDDFGTGYSSLAYLSRLPFDKLKIDRSFVARMGSDKRSHGIVRAITTLAHDLGKELVAEGVETTDQLAMLKSLGCEYAQGFLLSRPLPEENARSLAFQLENAGPGAAGGRP